MPPDAEPEVILNNEVKVCFQQNTKSPTHLQ